MEAARWPAISGLLSTHSAKHAEAQTDDERDRAAAHFGDGEKGTEHHVGEATGSDARVQTEAARGVREEEDGWQDAGGHEEQAKADRPCVKVEGLLEGEYHDEDVRVERPTHRVQLGCFGARPPAC